MSLESDEARRALYFTRAERQYEKQIAQIMRGALNDIRVEMSKIYEKYAVDGVLTKAMMTQYNRLTNLEKSITSIVKPATNKAIKVIEKLRPEEYGEAFFRTAWAIDNNTTLALKFGALNKDAVKASLDNPFFDSSIESLWFNANNRIPSVISNGLALGQSYTDMMKDLKGMVNKENFEIMRVLRTELHNSQESGTADGYDKALEQGVQGKVVWIATLDDRTRETHQEMDGIERDDDGMFRGAVGETPYPGWEGMEAAERISCRCDIRFELEGLSAKDLGRDEKTTYDEWSKDKSFWK